MSEWTEGEQQQLLQSIPLDLGQSNGQTGSNNKYITKHSPRTRAVRMDRWGEAKTIAKHGPRPKAVRMDRWGATITIKEHSLKPRTEWEQQ